MLQCVAVCCSVLQCVAACHVSHTHWHDVTVGHIYCNTSVSYVTAHSNTLQHTAPHCNLNTITLYHTATHCNTQQHTATHCNKLQHTATWAPWRCNTQDALTSIATHLYPMTSHTATRCHTSWCMSTLQYHYNTENICILIYLYILSTLRGEFLLKTQADSVKDARVFYSPFSPFFGGKTISAENSLGPWPTRQYNHTSFDHTHKKKDSDSDDASLSIKPLLPKTRLLTVSCACEIRGYC